MRARDWLLPLLRERFAPFAAGELGARFERNGLPYAPITRPQDLFDDPHLRATGGLAPIHVPADASAAGHAVDTHAPCCRSRSAASAWRCAARRRRSASTRASCCSGWATATRRSRR